MSEPALKSTYAEIDAACLEFAQQQQIPGTVTGIVRDGKLAHVTTTGLADIEAARKVGGATSFRIASMTKNMTALAILILRDEGRLRLDAPLSDYVPGFASVALPTRDSRPVSLRDLLTHVAGFVTDDPWGDRVLGMSASELDALIARGRLFARPPGLAFEYSNLGYALLGRVLTNVSGEPYQAFVRRAILGPLGMTQTTFDVFEAAAGDLAWGYRLDEGKWSRERLEPDGEVGAMGGLSTTAPDYARYVAFLLGAWPARDDPESGPARRATVRELALWHAPPLLAAPSGERGAAASGYGYGLVNTIDAVLGRRLHHSGGLPGYGSDVLMLPDRGWGVFAFGNRTYAPMSRLTTRVAEMLHAAAPPAEPARSSDALSRAVNAAVEAYAAGRIEVAAPVLAVNLLLDTPARFRNAELAALKQRLGEGRLEAIEPVHALAGRFTIVCARGRLKGTIVLSPDAEPGIQRLVFDVEA